MTSSSDPSDPFSLFGNTVTGTCERCGGDGLETARCPKQDVDDSPFAGWKSTFSRPTQYLCRRCWDRATDGIESRTLIFENSGLGVSAELRLVRSAGTSWTANKLFVAIQFLSDFILQLASKKPE